MKVRDAIAYANTRDELMSLLYDLDLMPEQVVGRTDKERLVAVVELWGDRVILRARVAELELAEAAAMALVLSHEGKIAELEAQVARITKNADFLRASVGECHLMISRNTSEFQTKDVAWEWDSLTLPHRLQKIMVQVERMRGVVEAARPLANDVRGCLTEFLLETREAWSNTNTRCVLDRLNQFDSALAALDAERKDVRA